jgi:hypothetical protein
MVPGHTVPLPAPNPQRAVPPPECHAANTTLYTAGYRALLLLVLLLPFDMKRHPLVWTGFLTITNLTVVIVAVASLALLTVITVGAEALAGSPAATRYLSRRRIPLACVVAFLIACAISTHIAHTSAQTGSWFLSIGTGALLWLAIPLWLTEHPESRINRLGVALLAGAALAALVGLIEVAVGAGFDRNLLLFKDGPSTMGPWLRLSATFSSANVAAMYFELALPCAVAAGMLALGRASRPWFRVGVCLATADLFIVAILLTYSRGALLGLVSAGIAMALAGRSGWRHRTPVPPRWRILVAVNLALICGAFVLSSPSTALVRISDQTDLPLYQATYASAVPATLSAGQTQAIPVSVENASPLVWNLSTPHAYGVSYHWLYPSWKVERFTNTITWLPFDLSPGERRTVKVRVTAPPSPGKFLLVWDITWKGTTWFAPKTGIYRASPVRVIKQRTTRASSGPTHQDSLPDMTYLPTAQTLPRQQIWAAAITMIEQHPLFGVASQGFRLNYKSVVPPIRTDRASKPPPHAHDLALEVTADWGIIGGATFAAMLVALCSPLLRRIIRGDATRPWELAVIGAIAALIGHQLVDYFLVKEAMFAALWILCGLAATMRYEVFDSASKTPGPSSQESGVPVTT